MIGGGATGLGTAVDAASRGFLMLPLELHDFVKGTFSRGAATIHDSNVVVKHWAAHEYTLRALTVLRGCSTQRTVRVVLVCHR